MSRNAAFILAGVRLLLPPAAHAQVFAAQQPLLFNGSFEQYQFSNLTLAARGWYTSGPGYDLSVDTLVFLDGHASLRSRRLDMAPYAPTAGTFGVSSQTVPIATVLGRSLRLSGWIRTDKIAEGYAGMWMRVDAGDETLQLDNMNDRGPRGTSPWTRFTIEMQVDSGATRVIVGVLHPGSGTAWFDSLKVEVFGPVMPRRVTARIRPTFTAPARPAEDFTRLLTDAELALPPDTSATPSVDTAFATWVRRNARPVRSLGATNYSDLAFLKPVLAGKRIVQLGESGHGIREFNMAKVRLIRYLHEELGYDVIAFESSLYACDRAGRAPALTAIALMRSCIFGVWHTEEVIQLFEYIKKTQGTARPLILTGFDTQSSSGSGDEGRSRFLGSVVSRIDSAYGQRVLAEDSVFRVNGTNLEFSKKNAPRLSAFYDSLAAWIGVREKQLQQRSPLDSIEPALARQVALSMSFFVRQLAAAATMEGSAIRDRGMADNLDFVVDRLHPGKRVMVWAHNFHVEYRGFGSGTTGKDTAVTIRTMGTYVAERRRAELYTVGLFMYRGSGASNDRRVYPVTPVADGSMEAILHRAPWRYSFVDLAGASRSAGTEWMYSRIGAKQWGTNVEMIVPREEYDGILFIDTTWPPNYLNR